MADDAVPGTPEAPKPDPREAEWAAEREKLTRERDEHGKKAQAWEQRYQSDMAQAVELVKQAAGQTGQPAQPAEPQDEDGIISRRELRAAVEAGKREALGQSAQEIGNILRMNRAAHRQRVQADPFYEKYKDEVENALDSIDPRAAALPDAYAKALQLAKANHFDEVLEEEVKRRMAPAVTDEEREEAEETQPTAPARSFAPPPSAPGSVSGRAIMAKKRRVEPLDPEEDRVRRHMGISEDAWRRGQSGEVPDFLGFRGRSRI